MKENFIMDAKIDKNIICRLCLSTKAKLNIFDSEASLMYKIKTCCAIEIEQGDGLPGHICATCIETLEIVNNFQTQCKESDKILRIKDGYMESPTSNDVKIEFNYEDNITDSPENYPINVDIKDELCPEWEEKQKTKVKNRKKTRLKTSKENAFAEVKIKSLNTKLYHNSLLCSICGKCFEKRSSYYSHLNKHNKKSLSCPQCSKVFTNNYKLKAHLVKHFGVKNIPCDECGKLFASKAYVQRHVNKVHKRLHTVKCTICMKVLANSCTLKYHMMVHTGEKQFSCDVCAKQFTNKFSLQYHVRTHTGEKPFSCKFCFKRFSDGKATSDHELLHTGETPYKCPVCSKGFAQLSNMKSHFRYNHKGKDLKDYPSYKKKDNKPTISTSIT